MKKLPTLFQTEETMTKGALFSEDRKHRYCLYRIWDDRLPKILFIGLNPSTADENQNDPTIRRVIGFAKNWAYGGIYMMNLFPYVSTDPCKVVLSDIDRNDRYLKFVSKQCGDVLLAWGSFRMAKERANQVIEMFPGAICLGKNADGSPKHPLYIPGNVIPIKFRP